MEVPEEVPKCIFAGLVKKYDGIGLRPCGTKDLQKWRGLTGQKTSERLKRYHIYFPELTNLPHPLEEYSICEIHYNQLFVNPQFYESLVGSSGSSQENKRFRIENEDDLAIELNRAKRLLEDTQQENQQMSQLIVDLNSQIERMNQYIENQKIELEELKKQLQVSRENMIAMRGLYEKELEGNNVLTEQWNLRFATQQKRIDAIIEIAEAERMSLLNDLDFLIQNSSRFSLDNLMVYSPREWLNSRNKVVVKFVETLVQNNYTSDILSPEKLFKAAVAVDSIYGARHGKYVSEIHLAAAAIKYTVARSKLVINIDNHITSCGSYNRFLKWQNELSKQEEPLPEGLLFLAFDNEQKGQKNYLDRGFNMVTYHIVTSFAAFNMSLENKIQHTNSPWVHDSLTRSQFDELFSVSVQMQEVIDKELRSYLAEVLQLLFEEKLSSTNPIDSLVASASTNTSKMKTCPGCNMQDIENRKRKCPNCKTQLPTLAEIQKEKVTEIANDLTVQLTNPLIFQPYKINEEQSSTSVLNQQVTDQKVDTPEIYIPDPININPNSIASVEKILLHIEKISGIKNGSRKWVVVTCDGVPYRYATKLKEKFPWLVLVPGQLHEEMNMLRAFVELNWEIDLKRYAICQGYRTENQLSYFKKCADHHKSWDSICTIYRKAMAMELLWPYVKSHPIPTVEGYLAWVKEQQDPLYLIKYEQTFSYLQAIINYRKAIRTNNPMLKKAARRTFSPVWSARRHPIYRLIEAADEVQLMKLHPDIRDIVEKHCVASRSGHYEQHQGLDAIIEEVNKTLKSLIPPIPQDHHWKIAARNCKKFFELRKNLFKVIGYKGDQSSGPRIRPESTMECQRFRTLLRSLEFVDPSNLRSVCRSLDGEYELNENLINFTSLAKQARQSFIIDTFVNKGILLLFRPIPITKREAEDQKNEANMTIPEIVVKVETLLEQLDESTRKKYSGLRSKRKSELLDILQEVKCLLDLDNDQDCLESSGANLQE